jgi:hypothetical protein
MKKLALYAMIAPVILMTGCASVLNEKTQAVNVSSSNGKAISGSVDGTPFTGPGVVKVTRASTAKVFKVDTEGCAKQTTVEKGVAGAFWGNFIIGGPFGSSTDYGTDKMWKYADAVVIDCGK